MLSKKPKGLSGSINALQRTAAGRRGCNRRCVMKSFADRVKSVEALLGADLPASYRTFLWQPYSRPKKSVGVPFRGELWDVQDFLRLDDEFKRWAASFPSRDTHPCRHETIEEGGVQ